MTELAGHTAIPAGRVVEEEGVQMRGGSQMFQGSAYGRGVFFTYLYAVYFAVLLVHRARRHDELSMDAWRSSGREIGGL